MAKQVTERKRYSDAEKQKHLKATEGKRFSEQKTYCEKAGVSINTLRSWRKNVSGTTSTKGKSGRKTAPKKTAAKKDGRKAAAKRKPGPKPGRKAGRKPGPKPGRKPANTSKNGSVKGRVYAELESDFKDKLNGGEGTLSDGHRDLLTDVHAVL